MVHNHSSCKEKGGNGWRNDASKRLFSEKVEEPIIETKGNQWVQRMARNTAAQFDGWMES